MKKFLFTFLACLTLSLNFAYANPQIEKAYHDKQSNIQVEGSGKVIRILSDDNNGSRHQRFLLKLPSKLTLLVAHNIDLSKKIENLKEGDEVEFYGEYEWNNKGGVIHWTHHDPRKKHKDGWLKHKSIIYK
jgi:molybdopterin converting factor small subunit